MRKLHTNETLSTGDLDKLERVPTDNKIGKAEYIDQAKKSNESFGVFVRTLVGLKREVAKELFNEFLAASIYTSNQIEFINLIINQLVGALSKAGVRLLRRDSRKDARTQRKEEEREGGNSGCDPWTPLAFFASWRLERSGRETQRLSYIPVAMRLMPSFMRSAPKFSSNPSRLSASFK